ncbi:MAG: potassium-transporting ATPase subunit KdpA [Streptosporangiaceae bacterium]
MSGSVAGFLQFGLLVLALAACYGPLGNYIAYVLTSSKHLRVERGIYKLVGIDPEADQRWSVYARSVLAFSVLSVLFVYAFERLQDHLPFSNGMSAVDPVTAWNTAASFTTNTNWQNYSGETTMGYVTQMSALAVQNFVSAAVGIAVAIALVRGLTRKGTDRLGNFWVDLTRVVIRILLPISVIGAIILVAGGVIDSFTPTHLIHTLSGSVQEMVGGPVGSQEVIKELGNNGGGFFNANSAHPFENPNPFTNWFEIFLLLLIPFALCRTFGKMVKDNRQGYALVAVMGILWATSVAVVSFFENQHSGTALKIAGAAMEGKNVAFGIPGSSLFAASTTATSTGAVNSFHDSFTAFGGGMALFNIMMGEVSPGGVGAGLYGLLVLAVVTVFIGGLMVGRTPEYLGKKIRPTEMKYASLYILATPSAALIGAAASLMSKSARSVILNPGAHGLTEVIYAFVSMANNNGSAFAGLGTAQTWYQVSGGLVMLLARFAPEIFALALAGSLARQEGVQVSNVATMPTHKPLFISLMIGVIVILVGLTYFPALALGPFAEGLH